MSTGSYKCLQRNPTRSNSFFSDEKTFVVDPSFNPQNERWIRFSEYEDGGSGNLDGPTGKFIARSKHPAGAMMLGAVPSTGEWSPPIWFPEGFRLGAAAYIEALRDTLLPWMRQVAASRGSLSTLPGKVWIQNRSAPSAAALAPSEALRCRKRDIF